MRSFQFMGGVLLLAIVFLSGCGVYNDLYGTENQDAAYVPDSSQPDDSPSDAEDSPAIDSPQIEVQPTITGDELTVVAQETDLVSLVPKASDPDGDALLFTFTSPLDENGEWRTTYGDEGQYTVTVTASDGELTTTKDILVIINKKEESPSIDGSSPSDASVSMSETETAEFSVSASDLNNDLLSYEWKLDGVPVSDGEAYTYESTYNDAGSHTLKVDVSDGTSSASMLWSVEVADKNRAPQLASFEALEAQETDIITLVADAIDDDGDALTYSISDSRFVQDDNEFTWETDYASAGTYLFTISVSDGTDTASQDISIAVENINRQPVILDVVKK